MQQPFYHLVPAFAATALKDAKANLIKYREEATKKQNSKEAMIPPLSFTLTQVGEACKLAMQSSQIVRSMMAAASK